MSTSKVNISKRLYDRLLSDSNELLSVRQGLALSIQERDNIRKAYEEVNDRGLLIQNSLKSQISDLTRLLENREASVQQLSQQHGKLLKLTEALALEKDKMSNALTSMWVRFEELIGKYHEATGHKAA